MDGHDPDRGDAPRDGDAATRTRSAIPSDAPSVESTVELGAGPRSEKEDRSGETLGHFRLLSRIGEGGMGVVYAALDERLGRTVALKILPGSAVANPERRRRFLREARAASAVMHPSIAAIFEVGEERGEVFLAMERVLGRTLRGVLRENGGPLAQEEALRIARDIARGLERAHAAGIVHRDLKPENVMQTPEGGVKILDFGLAKRVENAAGERVSDPFDASTVEGKILGTPGYMPPEQARGGAIDARADIFSLGALLHEMLAGERPFHGDSALEILVATARDPVRPASERNPHVTPEVDRLVARCLEKQPGDRFATCAELIAALDAALAPSPPSVSSEGAAVEQKIPVKQASPRSRGPAILAAIAVTAAVLVALAWWGRSRSPSADASSLNGAAFGSAVPQISAGPGNAALSNAATSVPAPPETSTAPLASGSAAAPALSAAMPRRPCLDTDRGTEGGMAECKSHGSVAWCDPGGRIVGCCGAGLVPKGEDGICGCAPGGTSVAEARGRGCSAVPADAAALYAVAKGKAMKAAIECFEPRWRLAKVSGGTFEATYFVTPEGEVFGARVQLCTLADEQAQSCALAALRAIRFPPPAAEEAGKKQSFGFVFGDPSKN